MAVSTVIARVDTYLSAITGTVEVYQGDPESSLDISQCPYFIITGPVNYTTERKGFSNSGQLKQEYDIEIECVIGSPGNKPYDLFTNASGIAYLMPQRVKSALAADHTLGGTCFTSDLGNPADNLRNYRELQQRPSYKWLLHIEEWGQANA